MPCDQIAVARARLDATAGVELLASEDALAILAEQLAPLMGRVPTIVRESPTSVLLQGERTSLRITRDAIQATNVWTSRDQMAALVRQAQALAEQLALPAAQERIVTGLEARYGQYAIQSDQQVGQARVVKLRIPL